MSENTRQPTKVSEDVYNGFTKAVEKEHGRTRGMLRSELERAMLDRIAALEGRDEVSQLADVNRKLDQLCRVFEDEIADLATPPTHSRSGYVRMRPKDVQTGANDGDTADSQENKSLPSVPVRPEPNEPIDKKSEYLALKVLNEKHEPDEGGLLLFTTERFDSANQLRTFAEAVENEYSFGDRARERLLEATVKKATTIAKERLGAEYPTGFPNQDALAWGPMLGKVSENQSKKAEEEADDSLTELENATHEK